MTISVVIAGNISQSAEVRHTPNGDAVAQWSVASNQGKDKPAIFLRCDLWGKRAEGLSQYLIKGSAVTVIGTLTQQKYNDKTTGQEKTSYSIKVQEVVLQGSRSQENAPKPVQKPSAPANRGDFSDMESDCPFSDPMKSRAFCLAV